MTAKSFIKNIHEPFRFGLTKRQLRERKRTEKGSGLSKKKIYQQLYNAKKAIFRAQHKPAINPGYNPLLQKQQLPPVNGYSTY